MSRRAADGGCVLRPGTFLGASVPRSVVALICLSASLAAQANPQLAGTWKLDQTATKTGAGRGGGVPGFPLAGQLVIKVSPTEVTVDSDTGSAQAIQTFVYKLDGSLTKVPGPLGWDTTAKAAVTGETLTVTVRRTIDGPNGPIGANVTEVYRVDGPTLTLERTLGATTQKLVYRR